MPKPTADSSKSEGLLLVVLIAVAGALITSYVYSVGVPEEVLIILVIGFFTFCGVVVAKVLKPKKYSRQTLPIVIPVQKPIVVAVRMCLLMLAAFTAVSLYTGSIFFVVYGHFEPSGTQEELTIGMEAGTFQTLATMPFTVLIGRFATYRLQKNALAWVLGTAFITRLSTFVLPVVLFSSVRELLDKTTIAMSLGAVMFQMSAAVAGFLWARRTQDQFVVRQVFRRLAPSDKKTFIGFIAANPKRW